MKSVEARGIPVVRVTLWAVHVALPAAGLWLLVTHPRLDHLYMHSGMHFWLILGAAVLSLALGILLLRAARAHRDMRLILVSLVFQLNSGFLGLHALATPGVILSTPNVGFTGAVPVGMVLGGLAALASIVEYGPTARAHRFTDLLAALPSTLMAVWALASLTRIPPFDTIPDPDEVQGPLVAAAFLGGGCYLTAAAAYAWLYLRNRATVLLSVLTAFVLLAEAMFAVGFGRSWRITWWEWHVLLGAAFALIAVSAHRSFRREGSARGLFDSVTQRSTVAAIQRDYARALEEMVLALDQRASGGVPSTEPLGAVAQQLSRRFGLTERQVAVLQQSARALGDEREQVRRLGALVAVGERANVIRGEAELLDEIQLLANHAFDRDLVRIGILRHGRLHFSDGLPPNPAAFVYPLTVKGIRTGALELLRPGAPAQLGPAEHAIARSFASQTSVTLENARLYQQLDGLFRSYMSPQVATALLADPSQAGLGGAVHEVSVLMADLRGYTPFAEQAGPVQVMRMLNTYYGAIVPEILAEGGTVVQFVGDAVMAIFNAPVRQPDHALRAARAGLAIQRATAAVRERVGGASIPAGPIPPADLRGRVGTGDTIGIPRVSGSNTLEWPMFRVGVNTGPAIVGNVGAREMRNFTAIGDTTNLAARLEGLAEPGTVAVGPLTRERLGDRAEVRNLGDFDIKGKSLPVTVYRLIGLR
ncbi:adenylate/guanylate cyclase domain-containing protein [Nocardia sp. SYP-A9097]|uniref:adenylate/guanylate cyclase domain-containing protein n=1 Tax=Nocardia sp. SYP-A9097 TaxID=2663237 RepID=UPI00129A9205|nr:adenylate/guanylate cyclase domain-containing protein [Nocardia sp. SYP-A9097]MRH86117.1 adenylate/guanylate cyclase domain-containing protein [Nocardia sp. SYP-A9097]